MQVRQIRYAAADKIDRDPRIKAWIGRKLMAYVFAVEDEYCTSVKSVIDRAWQLYRRA